MARAFSRRVLLALLGVGGLLGYELWPRDERLILSVLDGLCADLNQTRDAATLATLQSALHASLLASTTVQAAELGQDLSGVESVCERARALLTLPPLTFSLVDAAVTVNGALARVDANLIVSERGSTEQRRDLRLTEVRLRKEGKDWRIEAVRVDPVRAAEPEARP